MMLLDKSESGVELTLAFPLPNRMIPGFSGGTGQTSGKPYTYVTKTGRDIGEAYRSIQSDLSRKITFGQASVIVVGEQLAQEGMQSVLEFIAREPRFHINANLFVLNGKAVDLATIPAVFERFPSEILLAYNRDHVTIDATTNDFLKAFYYGGDMILPRLKFEKKKIPSESSAIKNWMGTDGAAIFKQGKLVASLNKNEMRGALWILGQLKDAEISVRSHTDGKNVNYMINRSKTKIHPVINGNQITVYIRTKADASLISCESDVNLQDREQEVRLEKGIEALVEQRMNHAIASVSKAGSDAYQISSYIDWYHPEAWKRISKNWREIYTNQVHFVPQADITIKRTGSVNKPLKIHSPESEDAN